MEIKTTNVIIGSAVITFVFVVTLISVLIVPNIIQYISNWNWVNIFLVSLVAIISTIGITVLIILANVIGEPIAKKLLR